MLNKKFLPTVDNEGKDAESVGRGDLETPGFIYDWVISRDWGV